MAALTDLVLDIVLSPALWMGVLFGLVYAILFTLWRGGGFGQMLRDVAAGVVGFALGQLFATLVRVPSPRVGDVHLLWGSLFCVVGLLIGRRYWRPRRAPKTPTGSPSPGHPSGGASAP